MTGKAAMKIIRGVLLALCGCATCASAQSLDWEARDNFMLEPNPAPPRIRLDDSRRRIDDLRDNATADDYRTIRTQGKNGRGGYRRVPTEEFAGRIERAEEDRDLTQFEIKARERSP